SFPPSSSRDRRNRAATQGTQVQRPFSFTVLRSCSRSSRSAITRSLLLGFSLRGVCGLRGGLPSRGRLGRFWGGGGSIGGRGCGVGARRRLRGGGRIRGLRGPTL